MHYGATSILSVSGSSSVFLLTLLFFAFASLATLACLLLVVAFGQDTHTPTKLSEVDLAIMVFIQHFHGFPDVICTDCILGSTFLQLNNSMKCTKAHLNGG